LFTKTLLEKLEHPYTVTHTGNTNNFSPILNPSHMTYHKK